MAGASCQTAPHVARSHGHKQAVDLGLIKQAMDSELVTHAGS